MSVNDTFSTKLKGLRETNNLNQSQLANKLGVSRGSISFYENAERVPDIEFLVKTADFFNVPVDYLLGRSSIPGNDASPEISELCDCTGLSYEAVKSLISLKWSADKYTDLGFKEHIKMIDSLLTKSQSSKFIASLSYFEETSMKLASRYSDGIIKNRKQLSEKLQPLSIGPDVLDIEQDQKIAHLNVFECLEKMLIDLLGFNISELKEEYKKTITDAVNAYIGLNSQIYVPVEDSWKLELKSIEDVINSLTELEDTTHGDNN